MKKGLKRDLLRPRDYKINFDREIGKRKTVTNEDNNDNETIKQSMWYCKVCECKFKDSHTYLDHINGKNHQKLLGMSMRTPISTLNEIKERLEFHKKRKFNLVESIDIKQRIIDRENEYERKKKRRKLLKLNQNNNNETKSNNDGNNINKNKYEIEKIKSQNNNDSIKPKTKKAKNNDKKNMETNDVELIVEQNPMMSAMGFDFQFGGSKKNR